MGNLVLELVDSAHVTIDALLQSGNLSFMFVWCSFSALICGSECVDVACILAHDHVIQIFVIEALAFAGHNTNTFVIVQIDAHLIACAVE